MRGYRSRPPAGRGGGRLDGTFSLLSRLFGRRPVRKDDPGKHGAHLPSSLHRSEALIRKQLGDPLDLVVRDLPQVAGGRSKLLYLRTMVSEETIRRDVLAPLMAQRSEPTVHSPAAPGEVRLPIGAITTSAQLTGLLSAILAGDAVLLTEGKQEATLFGIKGYPKRAITESTLERTTRGTRVAFVEELDTNLSLLRRDLPDERLHLQELQLGTRSHSRIVLAYMTDLVRPELIETIRQRLSSYEIDAVQSAGHVEQLLESHPYSPFPQTLGTESPSRVSAAILEGRVGILVSGTSLVLVVPAPFISFFQTQEDHSERFWLASSLRVMRLSAFLITLTLPALYVALVTFHPELLPLPLLVAIARAREGVPFPPVLEVIIFEFIIDLLREMGQRLPLPTGQALGVVGGIVLGDAAIRGGLASPTMLVIMVVTTITAYTCPSYSMAQSQQHIRMALVVIAATFGLLGLVIGLLMVVTHLSTLDSLGLAYFWPFAPVRPEVFRDGLVRAPLKARQRRPVPMASQKQQIRLRKRNEE